MGKQKTRSHQRWHSTFDKIIRKPKGVGTEVKCLADGVVGIMLQMEICEGKDAEAEKEWSYLPAGTAQTLRLSEFWHGSQRIVVGDSAFSSVTTAIECQKKGLFYSSIVKTASKEFPKDYLSNVSRYPAKEDHVSLTTVVENCKLLAVGWKDKLLKCLFLLVAPLFLANLTKNIDTPMMVM